MHSNNLPSDFVNLPMMAVKLGPDFYSNSSFESFFPKDLWIGDWQNGVASQLNSGLARVLAVVTVAKLSFQVGGETASHPTSVVAKLHQTGSSNSAQFLAEIKNLSQLSETAQSRNYSKINNKLVLSNFKKHSFISRKNNSFFDFVWTLCAYVLVAMQLHLAWKQEQHFECKCHQNRSELELELESENLTNNLAPPSAELHKWSYIMHKKESNWKIPLLCDHMIMMPRIDNFFFFKKSICFI